MEKWRLTVVIKNPPSLGQKLHHHHHMLLLFHEKSTTIPIEAIDLKSLLKIVKMLSRILNKGYNALVNVKLGLVEMLT
nr:unnamed protein product [Callosobruchus analis]